MVSTDPYAVSGASGYGGYDTDKSQKGTSDIGWHSVNIGFRITTIALLITAIGLTLLLLVTMMGLGGGGRNSGAIMANIVIWGGVAVLGAFFAMLTGWFVCLGVPRSSDAGGLAIGSVICICIAIGMLIIVAPAMGTMLGMGSVGSFRSAQALAQIIQWLTLISSTVGMALFGFFGAKVAKSFQDGSVNSLALANSLVQGGLLLWFVILQFGFRARSMQSAIVIVVVTFLLFIGSQLTLMFTVIKSRRVLTNARPW